MPANCIIIAQIPIESHSGQKQFAGVPLKNNRKGRNFRQPLCNSQYMSISISLSTCGLCEPWHDDIVPCLCLCRLAVKLRTLARWGRACLRHFRMRNDQLPRQAREKLNPRENDRKESFSQLGYWAPFRQSQGRGGEKRLLRKT